MAVGVGSASEPACVFERAEGAVDLAGFLVAANRSRASVRLIPSWRSLASVQMSSAVGSPRLSPNIQALLAWAQNPYLQGMDRQLSSP